MEKAHVICSCQEVPRRTSRVFPAYQLDNATRDVVELIQIEHELSRCAKVLPDDLTTVVLGGECERYYVHLIKNRALYLRQIPSNKAKLDRPPMNIQLLTLMPYSESS